MKIIWLLLIILAAPYARGQDRPQDTVKVVLLCSVGASPFASALYGYDVRELHNTSEQMNTSGTVICCYNFWKHACYLDESKVPLRCAFFVWQAADSNWTKKRPPITFR